MSGMSDVRLQLMGKELEAQQQPKVSSGRTDLGRWALMLHRWRTRNALLDMDASQLHDIGLSRAQAWEEGSKPFWK